MQLTFIYFSFPFWRSEVAKIALYLGDIAFENRVIDSEEFAGVKSDGMLRDGTVIPFHQFPCLLVDDVPICQTGAIARFCGKLSGVYPKDAPLVAAQIDQYLDIATDITELVFVTGRDKDPETKMQERQTLAATGLARKLRILDKMIGDDGTWIVGDSIGLPDIAIWRLAGWLSCGSIEGIPTEILQPFDNILRVCKAVDQHPKVKAWVAMTYPDDYHRGSFAAAG